MRERVRYEGEMLEIRGRVENAGEGLKIRVLSWK